VRGKLQVNPSLVRFFLLGYFLFASQSLCLLFCFWGFWFGIDGDPSCLSLFMRRYLSVPLIPFDLALFAKLQKWKLNIPSSVAFCFVLLGQNDHLFFAPQPPKLYRAVVTENLHFFLSLVGDTIGWERD
jgi:hypothetical protein